MGSPLPKLPVASVSLAATGVLFTADTRGYCTAIVQLFVGSGTVTWESSNDGVTWFAQNAYTTANIGASTPATTATAAAVYMIPCFARFVRARISAYTSGTFSCDAILDDQPLPLAGVYVGNSALAVTPTVPAVPTAAQGSTTFIKSAATTNATSVKASAGNLVGGLLCNTSATDKFIKFYNLASAPTVGSSTILFVIRIPAGQVVTFDHELAMPRFSTGIAFALTGALADADATAVAANDVSGWLVWA